VKSSILVLEDPWTADKFRVAMAKKVDSCALFYVAVPKPASATDNKTEFLQGKNYILFTTTICNRMFSGQRSEQ
jgi:hypothetical protein